METLKNRWNAKTPSFWKKMQKVGLVAGAIGGVLIAAPIALPATLVTLGGYLVTAGGVAAALSQLTVEDKKELED
jgi:ABC-type xylose transport system permease subunit